MTEIEMLPTVCVKSTLQHATLANPLSIVSDILDCFVQSALMIIFTNVCPFGTRIYIHHRKTRRPIANSYIKLFSSLLDSKKA
jgi:hypothetical protein